MIGGACVRINGFDGEEGLRFCVAILAGRAARGSQRGFGGGLFLWGVTMKVGDKIFLG